MGAPSVVGAVQDTITRWLPPRTVVGAAGVAGTVAIGVTDVDGSDGVLVPTVLVAVTVNV